MNSKPVTADKITIESTMHYKDTPVLHYRIEYPRFHDSGNRMALEDINDWYRKHAMDLQKKYETELYRDAVDLFEYTVRNQFPFHMFEAVSAYDLTYDQDGVVSLYHDEYTYTGGAHGSTVRRSETWDTRTGQRLSLFQFVKDPTGYHEKIMDAIRQQAELQIQRGENIYFEDYPQLISEHFNPESFYLTPEGVVIYFQQYEIAPYAGGLPEFTIPF